MGDETDKENSRSAADERDELNERANNFGWGIGMLVAGGTMLANQLGWIKSVDWFVPAVLVGLAVRAVLKESGLNRRDDPAGVSHN